MYVAHRGLSRAHAQFKSCDDISQNGFTHQLQLPQTSPPSGPRRLSAPERQTSTPVSSQTTGHTSPQRAFHAAGSVSVDMTSTASDDLVQFLMNSDDVRAVCCTPPRHRRRASKSNLVVDEQLTQRERTPSPCISDYISSPCLSLPGSGSPSLSPLDTDAPGPVRDSSRTRRAARYAQRSDCSSAGSSLCSSSSTGQLLDVIAYQQVPTAITHKAGSVGHLLSDDVITDAEYQLHGNVSMSTTDRVDRSPDSDMLQTQYQDDRNQSDRRTQHCSSQSADTDRLRQMSDQRNYDELMSSSRSKTVTSSSSSSSTGRSDKASAQVHRQAARKTSSHRGVKSDPSTASVTQNFQRTHQRSTTSTPLNDTSPTSLTNSLTSMSADSEKLLKEFDAIKKLKLFAGLGRHGRKSAGSKVQRADSGLRGGREVGVKQSNTKMTSAAVRSRTGNMAAVKARTTTTTTSTTTAAAATAAKLPKSTSTSSREAKQPVAGQIASSSGLVVGGKSRKPGQKTASKWSA